MVKPGVMFYFDIRPCIRRLTLEEKGVLFEAILDYGESGTVPEVDGALGVAWDFIQPRIDRDSGRYDKQVAQKQYAVFAREMKKKGKEPISLDEWKSLSDMERYRLISDDTERYPTNNSQTTTNNSQTTTNNSQTTTKESIGPDKPPSSRPKEKFVKPSVEEITAYCNEHGYNVNAERFAAYYDSNGWRVGRNPMKNWRAAVKNWENRDKEKRTDSGIGTIDLGYGGAECSL